MKEVAPILFLILGVSASPGTFECPCLNSSSAAYAAISAAAVASGLSSTYGLNGCAQYDVGNAICLGSIAMEPIHRIFVLIRGVISTRMCAQRMTIYASQQAEFLEVLITRTVAAVTFHLLT